MGHDSSMQPQHGCATVAQSREPNSGLRIATQSQQGNRKGSRKEQAASREEITTGKVEGVSTGS